MREIKFRFWSKFLDKLVIPQDDIFVGCFDDPMMAVMQFIGLKDKNGVEIYEGDVVEAEHISRPMIVFYSQDRAAFKLGHRGDKTQYDKQENLWPDECRVIGNIYENGDLLHDKSN